MDIHFEGPNNTYFFQVLTMYSLLSNIALTPLDQFFVRTRSSSYIFGLVSWHIAISRVVCERDGLCEMRQIL